MEANAGRVVGEAYAPIAINTRAATTAEAVMILLFMRSIIACLGYGGSTSAGIYPFS
jgi:hypothetical protein